MAYTTHRITTLDGGWVLDVSPGLLDQTVGYARELINIDLTAIGIPSKRPGLQKLHYPKLPDDCLGLHYYINMLEDTEQLIAAAGDKIVIYNDDTDTWDTIKDGLAGSPAQFLTFANRVAIVNGKDPSMLWDGSDMTYPDEFPVCSMITEWRNRIVASGIKDDPCKVMLSDIMNPELWDAHTLGSTAVEFYAGPDDGELITGIKNTGEGGVLILKPTKTYGLFGYTRQDMTLDLLDTELGGESANAVTYIRPHAYFCGLDGVFRYKGTTVERISTPIQTFWEAEVDRTRLDETVSAIVQRNLLVTVPKKDGEFVTLVFNIDKERWCGLWTAPLLEHVARLRERIIFSTIDDPKNLYHLNYLQYMDDTKPIKAIISTHEFDVGVPEREKDISDIYLTFLCTEDPYTVFIECFVDSKSVLTSPFVCEIAGKKDDQSVHRMHVGRTGRFFRLRLWSLDNTNFKPLSITALIRFKELI